MILPPFSKQFACPIRISRIAHSFIAILLCWRWLGCRFLTGVKFQCVTTMSGFCGWNIALCFVPNVGLQIGLKNILVSLQLLHVRFGDMSTLTACALPVLPFGQSSKGVLSSKHIMFGFLMTLFVSKKMSQYTLCLCNNRETNT